MALLLGAVVAQLALGAAPPEQPFPVPSVRPSAVVAASAGPSTLVERAALGDPTALRQLEKREPRDRSLEESFALARGREFELRGELNESPSAEALLSLLPLSFTMTRWGDEYYGGCGVEVEESEDARDVMEVGEMAVWPEGEALCIFFGPTPASEGSEPRAVSPVNPVGVLLDDPNLLKEQGGSIDVRVELES